VSDNCVEPVIIINKILCIVSLGANSLADVSDRQLAKNRWSTRPVQLRTLAHPNTQYTYNVAMEHSIAKVVGVVVISVKHEIQKSTATPTGSSVAYIYVDSAAVNCKSHDTW